MKRMGIWCFILCLLLGLCACGKEEQKPAKKPLEPYVEEEQDPSADTVWVTLREGLTIPEMAQVLEQNKVCSAADFITAVQTVDYDYDFLKAVPATDQRAYRLEGYLFPDTYEFYLDSAATLVVNRLLANFQKRTADLLPQIEERGWTLDEAVIFASMIQGEADTKENMKKVSRVLHNRLAPNSGFPKLQLCSTRDYVNHLPEDTDFDLEALKQAYNTYYREGLPIGAINNPGLDALRAALNPSNDATIKQCYYFATDYKTGITYFSKTYKEHQAIIKKYGITDIG
ncbi:MAG: endolytic transglycosylase MltG [Clostridia bacterium]|nr:endolytic transglycosylase MltG [Clostridia bacterium]